LLADWSKKTSRRWECGTESNESQMMMQTPGDSTASDREIYRASAVASPCMAAPQGLTAVATISSSPCCVLQSGALSEATHKRNPLTNRESHCVQQ